MDDQTYENHFPYYLTRPEREGLKLALKEWRERPIQYFSIVDDPELIQGDGIRSVPIFNPETGKKIEVDAVVLSNSCDISQQKETAFAPKIVVAPLIKLKSYINLLKKHNKDEKQIYDRENSIRRQEVNHIFFLPANPPYINEDHIAVLNDLHSINLKDIPSPCLKKFSLHLHGFYLFLFKLSVHFCRFSEKITRQ